MNITPFSGQLGGTLPASAMHHFTTAKFAQNITATSANGAQMGQVVGVISGGEGGIHYLRPVEGGAGFQALPHPATQQQLISVPITVPGAKPGDPQQTLQIQVMNPNVTALTSQVSMHQPKYQMAHIPLQTFPQGTVLTVAYAQPDGSEGVQIIGNTSLPEGLQVVTAIQPQDIQMLTGHMPEHLVSGTGKSQDSETENPQCIQIGTLLPGQQIVNIEELKKSNNNNNTFRIKQENVSPDQDDKMEDVEIVQQGGQQWTVATSNQDITEYLCQIPNGAQLHQFLRFNNDSSSMKSETTEVDAEAPEGTSKDNSKDSEEQSQPQPEENDIEVPTKSKKKKKYKKKPPKPKKPKPGQVVIATALDGTLLYCCPECHLAYPKKELLEQHLTGHKIERRYICGICGAGLKRREHLERHKLGHNPARPFVCSVCLKGFKRKEHLNLHFVIHSGEKTEICGECGKGFYRKDHLRKHTRAHATRRAREEMVAQYRQNLQQSSDVDESNQPATSSPSTSSMTGIQPEITIHVPTSTSSVPVHISFTPNLVSMASNTQTTTTNSGQLKEETILPH